MSLSDKKMHLYSGILAFSAIWCWRAVSSLSRLTFEPRRIVQEAQRRTAMLALIIINAYSVSVDLALQGERLKQS